MTKRKSGDRITWDERKSDWGRLDDTRDMRSAMANDAVTAFHSLDPETTDFEIACRAADYMIAEHGHVGQMVGFVARATPGGARAKLDGWQIEPPYDTPAVRGWMIDILLAGHSISVWYDDDGEEPTLNLGTLAVIRDGARKRRESPR